MDRWKLLFVLGLGLGLIAPAARADEGSDTPADRLEALCTSIEEHEKDEDLTKLVEDAKALEGLYKDADAAKDKKTMKAVVGELGDLSRRRKPNEEAKVVQAALLALGQIGDDRGAKYVKTYLRQPKDDEVPPNLIVAIRAAGMLHDDSFVSSLMSIVEDSKLSGPAITAMEALAKFGRNKRTRKKILEDLVDTVRKNRPGTRPTDRSQAAGNKPSGGSGDPVPTAYGGTNDRWAALSPVLPKTLNELTGEIYNSVDEWETAVKDYKNDLDSLFANIDANE